MNKILAPRHPGATPRQRPTGAPPITLADAAGGRPRAHAPEVLGWLRAQDAPPAPRPARYVHPAPADTHNHTAITRHLVNLDAYLGQHPDDRDARYRRDVLALYAPIAEAMATPTLIGPAA